MAKYTFTVYELEQNNFDFGLDKYEIFDENYRPILNKAILDYYRWREICFEMPALWKERLNARMDLIMRNKYNELYKLKQLDFNPLHNVDMTETYTHEISSNATSSSSGESTDTNSNTYNASATGKNIQSQYPSENMVNGDLTENVYVDNAVKTDESQETSNSGTSKSNTTGNQSSEGTTTETYTRTNKGSSAGLPFSKAMLQFKEYLDGFQLDQQVIDELQDLFIKIW